MSFVTLAFLAVALGYAAFERAGVPVFEWHICLLATGIGYAIHSLLARGREMPAKIDRWALALAAAFVLLAALQLAPLPVGIVRLLSPDRVELLKATVPFSGRMPDFVTLSAVPYNTAEYVITLLGYLVCFQLVRDIGVHTCDLPWAITWPLLAIAGFEAALGFYQAQADGGVGVASGTYDNTDHFAGLLEIVLPFAVMYPVAILKGDHQRYISSVAPALKALGVLAIAAALLVGIIYSRSRMGFMAALATLFVCGSLALSMRGWRVEYETDEVAGWRRWLPIGLVGSVVLAGFIFLPTDPLILRFSEFAKTDDISADTRAQIWRDTTGLIKAYPVTGCGLGAYESCFYKYKTVAPMYTVDYAHNDYLQVIAEMGFFGFLVGLAFILRLLQRTLRGALYARSIDHRYLSIACLASMTGMLLHSLVDFNMYVPANGYAFAWVLGIAWTPRPPTPCGAVPSSR